MPRYDVAKLKSQIKVVVAECKAAKLERTESWRAYSLIARERPEGPAKQSEWWERCSKALSKAHDSTYAVFRCADQATILFSTRAHIRGVLHMRKRRDQSGKFYGWCMEDQELLAADTLKELKLPELETHEPNRAA